jgi:hypothetical protein
VYIDGISFAVDRMRYKKIMRQRSSERAVQDASNPRGSCTTCECLKDGKEVPPGEKETIRRMSLFHPFVLVFHFIGNTCLGGMVARGVLCFF